MPSLSMSKTRYLGGLQCPKLCWYQTHRPEEIPGVDATTQQRFDQGQLVEEYARQLFPEGIEIPYQEDLSRACRQTEEALLEKVWDQNPAVHHFAIWGLAGLGVRVEMERLAAALVKKLREEKNEKLASAVVKALGLPEEKDAAGCGARAIS